MVCRVPCVEVVSPVLQFEQYCFHFVPEMLMEISVY
jgi:hypothetical protein